MIHRGALASWHGLQGQRGGLITQCLQSALGPTDTQCSCAGPGGGLMALSELVRLMLLLLLLMLLVVLTMLMSTMLIMLMLMGW